MKINLIYKTNKKIINPKRTQDIITKIVKHLLKSNKNVELNFIFTDNKEIKKFNKKFLNKNYPTDILCFKYNNNCADIIISVEQVIKNAKVLKVLPKEEFVFVIVHGVLHFKGMKDDTNKKREKMLKKGEKILKLLKEKEML
ncbi:MAG: rRNA maturation RNase YbeY [Endomicrobiia bacterium]